MEQTSCTRHAALRKQSLYTLMKNLRSGTHQKNARRLTPVCVCPSLLVYMLNNGAAFHGPKHELERGGTHARRHAPEKSRAFFSVWKASILSILPICQPSVATMRFYRETLPEASRERPMDPCKISNCRRSTFASRRNGKQRVKGSSICAPKKQGSPSCKKQQTLQRVKQRNFPHVYT